MNAKTIAKVLNSKLDDWLKNIEDDGMRKLIKENAIITGGALVSLLNGDKPNDYDIYFKTKDSCEAVARYYANIWNEAHKDKAQVQIRTDDKTGRITAFISSRGVAEETDTEDGDEWDPDVSQEPEPQAPEKPKYRPVYFSTNAISLSDKIQLIIRFYGDVKEIHSNYDFVHCTCSYDYKLGLVDLPSRALEAIINKELYYCGSKYPLCSIIRARKFIQRGWTINAGQYLKMCLQLNELNLKDLNVFADQLAGVDSLYFSKAIDALQSKKEREPDYQIENEYLFEVINRIF